MNILKNKTKYYFSLFLAFCIFVIFIIFILQPLQITGLFILDLVTIACVVCLGVFLKKKRARLAVMLALSISLIMTMRYMIWRTFYTLHFPDLSSAILGILLYVAEVYSWCVLFIAFFQSLSPLNRQVEPLPEDATTWPEVDIFIPTYNEDLDIVRVTLYGAMNLQWPKNKLNIYLLDDGNRPKFKEFAEEIGIYYIARTTHEHAKAGNLNHALKQTTGQYIAIFDCDHVVNKDFLLKTMGLFFKDKKLSLVQTPHYFFSPDPMERNLNVHKKIPSENNLFYGIIQDGNDTWNSTFFCGSCAVLQRQALEEIGGIATETVTEDAHTSLKMHRKGYNSAYLKLPLAAGLATETLSGHVGQRIRWARGMTQIFRLDNPAFGQGLSIPQRICYMGVMIHYLSCISRIIFLFSPLAFLIFHSYIISASAILIFLYVLPHLFLALYVNFLIQGKYRHSFFSEIYETILCFYIFIPVVVALIAPKKGTFNVTSKGGLIKEKYINLNLLVPILVSCLLLCIGVGFGIYRILYETKEELYTVIFSLLWCFYNLVVLGSCIYVSIESKQLRKSHRVDLEIALKLKTNQRVIDGCLSDFSSHGLGVTTCEILSADEKIEAVSFIESEQEVCIAVSELYRKQEHIGLSILEMPHEKWTLYIANTFGRQGIWSNELNRIPHDRMYKSLARFFIYGILGYYRLYRFTKIKLAQKMKHIF